MAATCRNQIAFRRIGTGPALILLHGLLGSSQCWRQNLPALSSRFTCWAFDLPGMGASDPLAGYDMSLARLCDWLEGALSRVAASRFSIVASSWGGALALQFAARSRLTGNLDALILAAPVHPGFRPSRRQRLLLAWPFTRMAAALLQRAPESAQLHILASMFGDAARMPGDCLAAYQAGFVRPDLGRVMRGYARHWRRDLTALGADLALIRQPVLLLWGGRDRVVDSGEAAGLLRQLPSARLHCLPELGHLPYEEDPAAFDSAVVDFLLRPEAI